MGDRSNIQRKHNLNYKLCLYSLQSFVITGGTTLQEMTGLPDIDTNCLQKDSGSGGCRYRHPNR